jgi:hypothetical protein
MEFVVVVVVGAFFFGGSRFLFGLLALPSAGRQSLYLLLQRK